MNDLENYLMGKTAESSGTSLMPIGTPAETGPTLNPARTIRKVAETLADETGTPGEMPKKLPQATVHVDTTGKSAPIEGGKKEAQFYALPSHSRYPLDSYAQVKQAQVYYREYAEQMAPVLRREYCSNLVKRASALGIPLTDEIRHYGAADYGSDASIEASLTMRVGLLKEAEHKVVLQKLSEARSSMRPDEFATVLGEFDKTAGIAEYYDQDIHDPYWSTFGEKKADDDGAILVGNDYISQEELKRFAKVHACSLKDVFGEDFVDEFRKDPVGVTKSLPVDQKKMVIRLASSRLTDPTPT